MQFVDRVFLPLYEAVHDVSIGMVEAMPEDQIDFRPAETVRTFREQIVHIATEERAMALGAAGQGWGFEANGYRPDDFVGRTALWNLLLQTRDEVVALARTVQLHRLHQPIDTPWGFTASPAQILMLMRDHTNNHNGKLSVYVRLAGAEPPFYMSLGVDTLKLLSF